MLLHFSLEPALPLPLPEQAVQHDALTGRLHKLKGAAAQLGAKPLAKAASTAEALLRSRDRSPRMAEQLALTARRLRELVNAAAPWLDDAAQPAPSLVDVGPVDMPDAAEIQALVAQLRAHDLAALATFNAWQPALRVLLGAVQMAVLCRVMDRLDFEAAAALLASAKLAPS